MADNHESSGFALSFFLSFFLFLLFLFFFFLFLTKGKLCSLRFALEKKKEEEKREKKKEEKREKKNMEIPRARIFDSWSRFFFTFMRYISFLFFLIIICFLGYVNASEALYASDRIVPCFRFGDSGKIRIVWRDIQRAERRKKCCTSRGESFRKLTKTVTTARWLFFFFFFL